jgi:hypothetical protein
MRHCLQPQPTSILLSKRFLSKERKRKGKKRNREPRYTRGIEKKRRDAADVGLDFGCGPKKGDFHLGGV